MITLENIQKFRSYGFALTPVIKSKNPDLDKTPKLRKGTDGRNHWSNHETVDYKWSDQELLEANRIGAFHRDSGIFDVDFDDKNFIANQFKTLLPPTLEIGKKVNERTVTTHLIYKTKDKVNDYKKSHPYVELLANTQSVIAGVDRVIINMQDPIYIQKIK